MKTLCALELRQRRELFLGQAQDLEEALAAANGGDVLRIDFDRISAGGQFADDGGESARGQRGGAFALDLRLDRAADADIEIGRRQPHLAVRA